ncbi:MAG: PKD domain-containing protein [Halobacteriales archaeon SW_9_67_25]|nr:MAG: PKD domain-containing protein [Halobacteriales archaeon SW_9_67_25]
MVTAGAALGSAGTASAHVPGTAPAQTGASPVQRATLVGDDSDDGDRFGWSMATDGDTLLVGAVTDDDPNGEQAGSVYVFERDGGDWSQTAKLAPDDGDDGDFFGSAVALAGETALVGARRDEDPASAGSAYVFERTDDGWEQAAKLVPGTITVQARLGWSVALAGETALVGAPQDSTDVGGAAAGTVPVFERTEEGWEQQATLTPESASEGDLFGTALSAAGDTVVVGAAGTAEPNGDQAGAAYVFERDREGRGGDGDGSDGDGVWSQTAKLVPDDGDDGDLFGTAVALDSDTALVPAVGDEDPNGTDAGSAYVFERDGEDWTQTAKLIADDGTEGDSFGWSVALEDGTALVGARRTDEPNGEDGGAAYLFGTDGDGWAQRAKIAPDGATAGARAGSSVALAGPTALLGATNDAATSVSREEEVGSVSVFDLTGETTPIATPTPTPTATPTPTPRNVSTPTPTPGEDGPGLGVLTALSGLAGWLWWRHAR